MGVYRRLLQLLPASYIWLFLVLSEGQTGHQVVPSRVVCWNVHKSYLKVRTFALKFGFFDSLSPLSLSGKRNVRFPESEVKIEKVSQNFTAQQVAETHQEKKIQTAHHPLLRQTNPQQTLIIDLILRWHICFQCVNLAVSQIRPLHSTRPDQCSLNPPNNTLS